MALAYDDGRKRLYEGDIRLLGIPDSHASVLLTDPPYASHKYIRTVENDGKLDPEVDMRWCGDIMNWVGQWWWPLRACLGADGVAWVFVNVHYMGFYLRWAHFSRLPLRGIFPCPPAEYLLAFGPEMIPPTHVAAIRAACATNTYGQNKPLPFLRTLLQASPEGLVLDPFAGLGSTLDAADLEGRPSVGVEIRPELVQATIARWTSASI